MPVGLGVLLIGFGALGGYLHWMLWHPSSGVLIFVAAGAAFVAAAGAALVPQLRAFALAPLAIAIGLLIGALVGAFASSDSFQSRDP